MNMQQFTGWLTRLLDALPWRHARRPAKQSMQTRMTSPRSADRFAVSDPNRTRRQKADPNPLCSTLNEDAPARHDALPPVQPPSPVESALPPAPLLALPAPAGSTPASASVAEEGNQAATIQVDPERRLAFARYLVRRGTFNEGFAREKLPAQYRRTQQD